MMKLGHDMRVRMKIYFAGSIRGGRDDWSLYLEIIERLKEYGEILTEHIGSSELFALCVRP
jgi:2'-deoxynucleoside 5'-phosphate N-hydrolase